MQAIIDIPQNTKLTDRIPRESGQNVMVFANCTAIASTYHHFDRLVDVEIRPIYNEPHPVPNNSFTVDGDEIPVRELQPR